MPNRHPPPGHRIARRRADSELAKRDDLSRWSAIALQAGKLEIFEWDAVTGKSRHSPGYLSLLGLAANAANTFSFAQWLQLVHPDDRESMQSRMERAKAHGGFAEPTAFRVTLQSGDIRWLESAAQYEFDESENLVRAIGATRDITEQKLVEQEWLANMQFVDDMVRHSPYLIMRFSREARVILVSDSAESLLGRSPDELLGKTLAELDFSPAVMARAQAQIDACFAQRASGTFELAVNTPHGQRILHVDFVPETNLEGDVYCLLAMGRDVTVERIAERKLRHALEWVDLAMDSADMATFDISFLSQEVQVSKNLSSWLGMAKPPENWATMDWRQWVHPDDRERVKKIWKDAYTKRAATKFECKLITESRGKTRWCYTILQFLAGDASERCIGTLLDTTHLHNMEEQRQQMQAHLQRVQKQESLATLAAGIVHDFNNLLTSAVGHVDLARGDAGDMPEVLQSLEHVDEALTQMSRLAKQMLAYAGRAPLQKKLVNLNQVVAKMVDMLRVSVGKRAQLHVQTADYPVWANADEGMLQQVIMNLLINASEAIQDADGHVTVRTRRRHSDSLPLTLQVELGEVENIVELSVTDTGSGMDANTRDRLFEPFFSSKRSGRGLGLSIVAGIVRSHKGVIGVDSELGCGSTITIILPEAEAVDLAESKPASSVQRPQRKITGTVLVVDDESSVRNMLCRALQMNAVTTLVATHGDEAIALANAHPEIQVVLMDITMPQKDGIDTFLELRRFKPDLAVVLMSGYAQRSALARLGEAINPPFLSKPFRPSEMIELLEQICDAKN
jgi:two-component system, cell cycle sensor histidine kinase and response regulator CckA